MLNSYFQGLMIGLSLIVAIGAQNAFILKQGLIKQHVFLICFICALSDSILIVFGVLGFSKLMALHPEVVFLSKYFGALFLIVYGAQHFYQAMKMSKTLNLSKKNESKWPSIVMICLALTWLNPHVYLDTVILVGNLSTQYETTQLYFTLGVISASWIFFYSLGYAARFLLPWFSREKSWKILDLFIGLTMWTIAISLVI